MKGIVRLSGLLTGPVVRLAVGLVVALVAVAATAAPARAEAQADRGAADRPAAATSAPADGLGVVGHEAPGEHQVSTGGCGFLQVCLYFNRTEQKWIGGASVSAVAALVCSSAVGCAAAGAIAYAVVKYVDKHGICPRSRPRLRVKVFPTAHFEPSCSD